MGMESLFIPLLLGSLPRYGQHPDRGRDRNQNRMVVDRLAIGSRHGRRGSHDETTHQASLNSPTAGKPDRAIGKHPLLLKVENSVGAFSFWEPTSLLFSFGFSAVELDSVPLEEKLEAF